jgi:4-hydroxy-tetrahydrodipicolinate synthase
MSVETMKRLFELPNIVGVKDATGDLGRVSRQRHAMGADFIQLSGEDMTALAAMAAGSHGCIAQAPGRTWRGPGLYTTPFVVMCRS